MLVHPIEPGRRDEQRGNALLLADRLFFLLVDLLVNLERNAEALWVLCSIWVWSAVEGRFGSVLHL